jgi:hypothetical protein
MILNVAKLILGGGGGGGGFLASRAQLMIRPTVFVGHSVFLCEKF